MDLNQHRKNIKYNETELSKFIEVMGCDNLISTNDVEEQIRVIREETEKQKGELIYKQALKGSGMICKYDHCFKFKYTQEHLNKVCVEVC